MKITDIKSIHVWDDGKNLFILKIETDEGLYGWGEAGLSTRGLAIEGAVSHFREFLIGADPMKIGALWQHMYRSQYFEGGRILTAAISAIDIALHDIVGKKLGVPVYQLLGGAHRNFVPCFVTSEVPLQSPDVVSDTKRLVSNGWKVIRFVPGHPETGGDPLLFEPRESLHVTSQWLREVRESVGHEIVLGIDYHHRLSVAEAASFCQKMPDGTLDFLEEPIRAETPEAYESLGRMTRIPFAIGEEFSSKWAFLPYIERGLTNFARLDICNVGGFTEAMKVAGWCEAHYIDMMPHNPLGPVSTAANIHFAAAVSNYAWLEDRVNEFTFSDKLFPVQYKLEGTRYRVPSEPGLGVEFDEEANQGESFRFSERPHLHKNDGSLTNW
jgi:galactonate dehydratase